MVSVGVLDAEAESDAVSDCEELAEKVGLPELVADRLCDGDEELVSDAVGDGDGLALVVAERECDTEPDGEED